MTVPKKTTAVKQTGIRLPEDLYRALRIRAAEMGESISLLAGNAIRAYLNDKRKREAA